MPRFWMCYIYNIWDVFEWACKLCISDLKPSLYMCSPFVLVSYVKTIVIKLWLIMPLETVINVIPVVLLTIRVKDVNKLPFHKKNNNNNRILPLTSASSFRASLIFPKKSKLECHFTAFVWKACCFCLTRTWWRDCWLSSVCHLGS